VTDIERGPGASCCGRAGETAASSIAFAFRSQTMVAHITEVEVSRRTGHVWEPCLAAVPDALLERWTIRIPPDHERIFRTWFRSPEPDEVV